jgi:hypothetical protein
LVDHVTIRNGGKTIHGSAVARRDQLKINRKSVSIQVSNKSAANSPVKPSAPEGPARMVLAVPDEPARGRKPVLRDEVAAVVAKQQYPRERLRKSRLAKLVVIASICASAHLCFAQSREGDGVYGRFDNDTIVSGGAGVGISTHANEIVTIDLRARYLDSAGFVLAPEFQTNGDVAIAAAIDIRPFFLGRFLTNTFSGISWVDLVIDSIGVEIGSWVGPMSDEVGAALLLGGGVDLPLGADGGSGLWLRLGARWIYTGNADLAAPQQEKSKVLFFAVLYYRGSVDLRLAPWESSGYSQR